MIGDAVSAMQGFGFTLNAPLYQEGTYKGIRTLLPNEEVLKDWYTYLHTNGIIEIPHKGARIPLTPEQASEYFRESRLALGMLLDQLQGIPGLTIISTSSGGNVFLGRRSDLDLVLLYDKTTYKELIAAFDSFNLRDTFASIVGIPEQQLRIHQMDIFLIDPESQTLVTVFIPLGPYWW